MGKRDRPIDSSPTHRLQPSRPVNHNHNNNNNNTVNSRDASPHPRGQQLDNDNRKAVASAPNHEEQAEDITTEAMPTADDKAARKAARKAAKAAEKARSNHTQNGAGSDEDAEGENVQGSHADGIAVAEEPPRKKHKKRAGATVAQDAPSNVRSAEERNALYDHSHVPAPLHPSLAGLLPVPHQQQQQPYPATQGAHGQPSQYQQQQQNGSHHLGGPAAGPSGLQQRDIPVDPVLLGLPVPPPHFATSSVRGGAQAPPAQQRSSSGTRTSASGSTSFAPQDPSLAFGNQPAPRAETTTKQSRSKEKGKEKAVSQNQQAAATTDGLPATPAATQTRPAPSSSQGEGTASKSATSTSASTAAPAAQPAATSAMGFLNYQLPMPKRGRPAQNPPPTGADPSKDDFYEQLRTKWMSTKDLKQLAEQYGVAYKSGKFSNGEDATLRTALESYRVGHNLSPADLRALLTKKRDVRLPLARKAAQNEIWEYLARALGDRPLLSIYNHVKLLVAGDPLEAASPASGEEKKEGDSPARAASTDANAEASGSGTKNGNPKATATPPVSGNSVPAMEGILGDANRKGRWSKEEDDTLCRAFQELGSAWSKIGEMLGRSGTACRDRWTKQLNNGLALGIIPPGMDASTVQKPKEGKWTDDEVEQLKKLHAEYGSQWKTISQKLGGARTSTQCRTKWNDYIARREAVQKDKEDGQEPANAGEAGKDAPGKDEWRWQAVDGSRLIHAVAALEVNDPSEVDWKVINDPRLARHGPKNLRDRYRHLIKNAKREMLKEGMTEADISYKDAFSYLMKQHPTPDFDPSQAVCEAEKTKQRAQRRAERKAARKAEREQREQQLQRAQMAQEAAMHVAHLAAAAPVLHDNIGLPVPPPPAPARNHPTHEQLIGRTSNLSQAFVDDSDDDGSGHGHGDIRVDLMGRRV